MASNSRSSVKPLTTAVKGDHVAALTALRDRLAVELDKPMTTATEVASLSRQLVDVLARLAAIKPPTSSKGDDIAKQRAKRRSTAAGPPDAADSQLPGG
jgi:predicted DNA-binding helix-hairpin-helix protein